MQRKKGSELCGKKVSNYRLIIQLLIIQVKSYWWGLQKYYSTAKFNVMGAMAVFYFCFCYIISSMALEIVVN